MDYLSQDSEIKLVKKLYPELYDVEVKNMTHAVRLIREGFSKGEISVPLTTRDLINWTDKYLKLGDMIKAATYCFLNRMRLADSTVCLGIITRICGHGK